MRRRLRNVVKGRCDRQVCHYKSTRKEKEKKQLRFLFLRFIAATELKTFHERVFIYIFLSKTERLSKMFVDFSKSPNPYIVSIYMNRQIKLLSGLL